MPLNLIKYPVFTETESLKKSIFTVMNKVLNYKPSIQQSVFQLLMEEYSSFIKLKLLSSDFNVKIGYWSYKYGPCNEFDLCPKYLDCYYISIFKYFDRSEYTIKVTPIRKFIKYKYNISVDQWKKEYEEHLEKGDVDFNKKCIVS